MTPRYHLSLWCNRFLVPLGYMPKLVYPGELPERSHRFQKARERWPAQKITAACKETWTQGGCAKGGI